MKVQTARYHCQSFSLAEMVILFHAASADKTDDNLVWGQQTRSYAACCIRAQRRGAARRFFLCKGATGRWQRQHSQAHHRAPGSLATVLQHERQGVRPPHAARNRKLQAWAACRYKNCMSQSNPRSGPDEHSVFAPAPGRVGRTLGCEQSIKYHGATDSGAPRSRAAEKQRSSDMLARTFSGPP